MAAKAPALHMSPSGTQDRAAERAFAFTKVERVPLDANPSLLDTAGQFWKPKGIVAFGTKWPGMRFRP